MAKQKRCYAAPVVREVPVEVTPALIGQLVEAIRQTPEFQFLKVMMAQPSAEAVEDSRLVGPAVMRRRCSCEAKRRVFRMRAKGQDPDYGKVLQECVQQYQRGELDKFGDFKDVLNAEYAEKFRRPGESSQQRQSRETAERIKSFALSRRMSYGEAKVELSMRGEI